MLTHPAGPTTTTACVRARLEGPRATLRKPSLDETAGLVTEVSLDVKVRGLWLPSGPGLTLCGFIGAGACTLPLGEPIRSLLDDADSECVSSPVAVPVPWLADELTTKEADDEPTWREKLVEAFLITLRTVSSSFSRPNYAIRHLGSDKYVRHAA